MTKQPTPPTPPMPQPSQTPQTPPAPVTPSPRPSDPAPPRRRPLIIGAWLWVALPLAYGLYELVHKAKQLFTG
ncbi:hypothetical protein GCM10010252_42380 [Streptomyces aureoverticillatus]|nr:hypothetical protein GCM10010252_42380 [Streptomyces aureoverticillatus]